MDKKCNIRLNIFYDFLSCATAKESTLQLLQGALNNNKKEPFTWFQSSAYLSDYQVIRDGEWWEGCTEASCMNSSKKFYKAYEHFVNLHRTENKRRIFVWFHTRFHARQGALYAFVKCFIQCTKLRVKFNQV